MSTENSFLFACQKSIWVKYKIWNVEKEPAIQFIDSLTIYGLTFKLLGYELRKPRLLF